MTDSQNLPQAKLPVDTKSDGLGRRRFLACQVPRFSARLR